MEFSTILLIAVALAVDAFAVAIATGICLPKVSFRHMFRLAWHFGLFQAGMNIIGWAAGLSVRAYIESFDHWLAFILLAIVGGRMIWEALEPDAGKDKCERDPTRGRNLVMLSIATSIDALAVGLSFAVLKISIWLPALIIGVVATAGTAFGIHLGHKIGSATNLGKNVEIIGGLVLVGIGINILHVHGVF